MLRIAIIAGNYAPLSKNTQKGTEFLTYTYLQELHHQTKSYSDIDVTVFASGNSDVPFRLVSMGKKAVTERTGISLSDQMRIQHELLKKAANMHEQFDLYHLHISNGQDILPLATLIDKPILITMYGGFANEHQRSFFSRYQHVPNVWFVPVVKGQKQSLPFLRYTTVIPHGIDLSKYPFDPDGGTSMMWAGRAIKEKGPDVVVQIVKRTHRPARLFPIINDQWRPWFEQKILNTLPDFYPRLSVDLIINQSRYDMAKHFQSSKLLLFPISWEEPFGIVIVESMASGTPVVAYARGSTPNIVTDGSTGFLVNASPKDVRGDWIIKKTGIEGLIEAVDRIYAMNPYHYKHMRDNCRKQTEKKFSLTKTVKQYRTLYKKITF